MNSLFRTKSLFPLVIFLCLLPCTLLFAAPPASVRFELATQGRFSPQDAHAWNQLLSNLHASGIRITGQAYGNHVEVINEGTERSPRYLVKGVLNDRRELVVPGGRFRLSDGTKLAAWLDELRKWGPQGSPSGQAQFGLNASQFAQVKRDLSAQVLWSTKGKSRIEQFERIQQQLDHRLQVSRFVKEAIEAEEVMQDELKGITSGTALAALLRPCGLGFRPARLPGGEIEYQVETVEQLGQVWPLGWELDGKRAEAIPLLLTFLDVEIDPTPLEDIFVVLSGPDHLNVPILWDHNQIARHQVNLRQPVSHPPKRTYYDSILRTLLSQAQLTREVRQDEGGKPFLWITTMKR
ncbi:Hypothetical protein PBC10988_12880 [Planctomycetales bacterium 10988]|nr:Hypothetical protein PBC10988_12880 [Planctomycetales bacterium 10988]